MNAGLCNLDTLRKHLLAASLGAEPKFDTVLAALGRGVAGLFDTFCNRKLAYVAADQFTFSADRSHVILQRYPVVAVSTIETRYSVDEPWTPLTGAILSLSQASGLLRFATQLGDDLTEVRLTYTGGYWFSALEPDDAAYPEAAPAGATELPADLLAAFLLQCENVWQSKDRLGASIVSGENTQAPRISSLDLVPQVKTMLQSFIRYRM